MQSYQQYIAVTVSLTDMYLFFLSFRIIHSWRLRPSQLEHFSLLASMPHRLLETRTNQALFKGDVMLPYMIALGFLSIQTPNFPQCFVPFWYIFQGKMCTIWRLPIAYGWDSGNAGIASNLWLCDPAVWKETSPFFQITFWEAMGWRFATLHHTSHFWWVTWKKSVFFLRGDLFFVNVWLVTFGSL